MSVKPAPSNRDKLPQFAKPDYTNVQTARKVSTSTAFVAACAAQGVKPTVRQARKYLAGYGRWASARLAA